MAKPTFTVIYPKGFLDKLPHSGRPDSKAFCEKWNKGCIEDQSNVLAETIPITLEELILNFNNIIKTYKLNPTHYLAINDISKILTNEESVIKYALPKLDGTKGRCVISKKITYVFISYKYVSYNPILKETRKQLLILFNRFKKSNESDIIMYEGHQLFIHLFAIIIDSLHVPCPDGKKKDCTDIFPMITLLELLLNKKYKNILESSINNIPLDTSIKQNNKSSVDDESSGDDEWDKDDFEPVKTIPLTEIDSISKNDNIDEISNTLLDINKGAQIEEIPDEWDNN